MHAYIYILYVYRIYNLYTPNLPSPSGLPRLHLHASCEDPFKASWRYMTRSQPGPWPLELLGIETVHSPMKPTAGTLKTEGFWFRFGSDDSSFQR